MGNCACASKTRKVASVGLPGPLGMNYADLSYPRHVSLKAMKQSPESRAPCQVQIEFQVTEPLLSLSRKIQLTGHDVWVSGTIHPACVLPGMDPHLVQEKACQDLCFFDSDGESLLCGLFDGHGQNGKAVVNFCVKLSSQFYATNKGQEKDDPQVFLEELTKKCDGDMKVSANGVDSSGSGSTAVFLLLRDDHLDIASVGDSRAVLGSLQSEDDPPAFPRPLRGETKENIENFRRRRAISSSVPIYPVQLTRDQKPEDPEELVRIFKAGGRVQQLTDEQGRKIGPYRVWKPNTNGPGIAMSRSIGDTVGSDLGVISEPIITNYAVKWESDLFMVSASDGVWDVMENADVVRFIERYRHHCIRGEKTIADGFPVNCTKATIAQMLCEEARTRWFGIVEKEEVFIDDISCVITELQVEEDEKDLMLSSHVEDMVSTMGEGKQPLSHRRKS